VSDDIKTTGYRLTDGRYYIVTSSVENRTLRIKQIYFLSGIYPAPIKDVGSRECPGELKNILSKKFNLNNYNISI